MRFSRLLAAFLLVASAATFAQAPTLLGAITPLGPWDIAPQIKADGTRVPLAVIKSDQSDSVVDERVARLVSSIPWDPSSQTLSVRVSREGKITAWVDDSVCFSMRSYKVARDSKDSDAVHPAGYTTCQPGRRYGLKTTDLRSNSSPDRSPHP